MRQTRNETTTPPNTLRRGKGYDPWHHADQLGITVIERPLTVNELWVPDLNTLVLDTRLRQIHKRTALAHGIAHAELGHRDSRPKHETQADQLSARYLIHPDELQDVAQWADGDWGIVCVELAVTTQVLAAYLRHQQANPT